MSNKKKYWKGLEQLQGASHFEKHANKEFAEELPLNGNEEPSRRDFLKMMGFGVAAVSIVACETPIRKAIPYVKKPDTIDPSIPNYYASTYVSGSDVASVVVKTREGRPIKVEGNKLSPLTGGGTSSQIESSVLSLYDKERLTGAKMDGKETSWEEVDAFVTKELAAATGIVYLVSNSIASPSTLKAIGELKAKYNKVEHVAYDQLSVSGMLDANEASFGKRAVASSNFENAKTIVSFGADFLGSGPNKTLANKQFAASRKLSETKKTMSRLYAFESNLTLTGANADYRTAIKASEEGSMLLNLYNIIAAKKGGIQVNAPEVEIPENLKKAGSDLLASEGSGIVLSYTNDKNIQYLVNAINGMLGNIGSTIDVDNSINMRSGSDADMIAFVSALTSKSAAGIIFYNCNPVYDHPLGAQIEQGLANVSFTVATNDRNDETSSLVKINAPDHHYLESWNDFEVVDGHLSLSQPTISNIFSTRQAQDSFLQWAGVETTYYDYLQANWESSFFAAVDQSPYLNFQAFWDKSLHDGVLSLPSTKALSITSADTSNIVSVASSIKPSSGGLEVILYSNSSVAEGIQANNPWLQEMPDPITKACWDNYLTVAPSELEEWGVVLGDMSTNLVKLTVAGQVLMLPALPQPGQKVGTVGLALGYGRTKAGKVANGVGSNAYPLIKEKAGYFSYVIDGATVEVTSEVYQVAQTQTSQTYMGRETIIQESTLTAYQEDPQAGRHFPKIATSEGFKKPYAVSLWKGHQYANHHWGLAIDLNSCTGCGTCTIACQTENNIPVVGKQEVLNRREMHWIRIDRYYSHTEEADNLTGIAQSRKLEEAAENPEVVFQPMMCQQCNNAPCETVCPVAATTHSTEGLNQMTYNRCIGTRYCANNCPYKVRRFNWFKYHDNDKFDTNLSMNNDLGKMVLNPDVTVRARGVMEKCTFCVQRIQSGKLEAKRESRRPNDNDITTACVSSCPSDALVFGDLKDPESKVSKFLKLQSNDKGVEALEPRAYHVLEELRVMPNVWYLTKIRNRDAKEEKQSAAHS
ncbi:MAG: MoCo/4Fe-4S cofactor protein with predicted Tat translocation signal [Cyclobacteriaceae bacterium]|jgi:MoCo/4Fe-4S cofactor protein with predicted Tat translocation signal